MGLTLFLVNAVVRSITELFPIGSDAHRVILDLFPASLAFSRAFTMDLALGLILAVLVYFWRDVGDMAGGVIRAAKGKRDPGARLALQIVVAAIPTLGLGFALETYVFNAWQMPTGEPIVIGWVTLGVGLLILLLDRMSMTVNRIEHTSYGDAILVSLCYVFSLIPGAGGAAVAMTMARMLGYERAHAVRLALLVGVPLWATVLVREAYIRFKVEGGEINKLSVTTDALTVGTAFIAALISIAILMAWLRRGTFTPFLVYRLLIGAGVLLLVYDVIAL